MIRVKYKYEINSIVEVCSGAELPEVEIISLLEEQIPRYRLRADTLTQFQGKYEHIIYKYNSLHINIIYHIKCKYKYIKKNGNTLEPPVSQFSQQMREFYNIETNNGNSICFYHYHSVFQNHQNEKEQDIK